MILTITTNAALDRVIFIPEFQPAHTMRAQRVIESVGGKGLDTSVALHHLGVPNLALSLIAGPNGRRLEQLLDRYGIPHELIWVEGDTRIAYVIVESEHHRHSHIIASGYTVSPPEQEAFVTRFKERVAEAGWVVVAGSLAPGLPDDFYACLTDIAHQSGARVLIDCPGKPAIQALSSRPEVLKMNRTELASTFKIAATTLDELAKFGRKLIAQHGLPALVITCGEDGLLAVTDQSTYLAFSPLQQEVNAAGAGDAVSAALAWRFLEGDGWPQALHWAAAASAAVVLTEGTAELRIEDARRIYATTTVATFQTGAGQEPATR